MLSISAIQPERSRPVINTGPGMTKQSMKDECNVNLIMAKYQKTGLVSFVSKRQAEYMDAPAIDFQQAMDIVKDAENMFLDMPSSMRKRFQNDPGEFYEFIHNPDNKEEMYKLGLAIEHKASVEPPIVPLEPEPVQQPA